MSATSHLQDVINVFHAWKKKLGGAWEKRIGVTNTDGAVSVLSPSVQGVLVLGEYEIMFGRGRETGIKVHSALALGDSVNFCVFSSPSRTAIKVNVGFLILLGIQ
jgi:hypothetical protein